MKKRFVLLSLALSLLSAPAAFAVRSTCSTCIAMNCSRVYSGYRTCTQTPDYCAVGPDECVSAAPAQAPATFAAKWHLASVTTKVTSAPVPAK